jgi:hypothetical protein
MHTYSLSSIVIMGQGNALLSADPDGSLSTAVEKVNRRTGLPARPQPIAGLIWPAGAGLCQDPLVAASYCSTTLAGMRLRSLTVTPWS